MGKAEETKLFILDKVAPYFNRHGYHGTSMNDLTSLTGLTKGALYGNFKDKETLAIEAFHYNVQKLLSKIRLTLIGRDSGLDQIEAVLKFYSKYIMESKELGGCPVISVGTDSLFNNEILNIEVKKVIDQLKGNIQRMLERAIEKNEIQSHINPQKESNIIYATIQGGVFSAFASGDHKILQDAIQSIRDRISIYKT